MNLGLGKTKEFEYYRDVIMGMLGSYEYEWCEKTLSSILDNIEKYESITANQIKLIDKIRSKSRR